LERIVILIRKGVADIRMRTKNLNRATDLKVSSVSWF